MEGPGLIIRAGPSFFTDMKMHPSMNHFANAVLQGEYDIPGLRLGKGDTVIDVGANCGAFVEWALKRWMGCRVVAYEPNPDAYRYLWDNFGDEVRVSTIPYGVRSEAGSGSMYHGKNNLGEASYFYGDESRTINTQFVSGATLPRAAFLKIDCEGCEVEVLSSCPHLKEIKGVAVEYHSAELGYVCGAILEPTNTYRMDEYGQRGIIKWTPGNLTFTRN